MMDIGEQCDTIKKYVYNVDHLLSATVLAKVIYGIQRHWLVKDRVNILQNTEIKIIIYIE